MELARRPWRGNLVQRVLRDTEFRGKAKPATVSEANLQGWRGRARASGTSQWGVSDGDYTRHCLRASGGTSRKPAERMRHTLLAAWLRNCPLRHRVSSAALDQ